MIEVFRTNIINPLQAEKVRQALRKELGYTKTSFDLQDCDRILRIEAGQISSPSVIRLLASYHCACEVLPG